ncbi:efflux transporter, outer membrane factor (OMF) lipoprotein, NodT family [Parapedobacter luteus]|uniref:Efflux transporter, outer membrane factor (OMF) lipoprotein, NodT family n=1 Tax=Parapedobacter luteus TaxID=623280 RepID=A0A1T5CHC8_9SPHI|nr:efflux transporter outer membrane subunit [Parapedobacter luteus]SKB58895.1 efflux transporter, outer membrane factor (OMF) lipoprotein, NodT family [Parapedobacter luteus]
MMKSIRQTGLVAIIGCLLASSCKLGRDYVRPDTGLTAAFRGADTLVGTADTANIADIPWYDFFTDSMMIMLIDSAIANNYDMQTALKNIEIANQSLRQSRAAFFPEVEAQLGGTNQQWRSRDFYSSPSSKWYGRDGQAEPPDNLFMYQSQYLSSISISWELDIWGKMRRQNESALAEYLQTFEARKAIQTGLIATIAEGYYNLLMLDAQLEVARRNLRLNDSTLQIVKLQRDAGEVSSLAIQQTESQMLLATSLIPQLEQEIAIQENALMALTGRMPDSVYRSSALMDWRMQDTYDAGVPLQLLANRPDVRAAELALRAANADVGVAQAYRYPTLTIDASGGINAMLPQNWFNIPGALFGGLISGATQPVFSRRRLKTQHEIAKLERDKAEISFQQTVMDAVHEVTNALIMIEKLNEQYAIAERRVATAQLGVKNANLLFKSGEATYLEVITAQSNALTSELDLVSIKQQQLNAKVGLYRALGGGWK